MDKKQWLEDKVAKLIAEGKSQDEAIAIANSMYEDEYGDKKEVATPEFVEDTPSHPDGLAVDPVAEKSLFERMWSFVQERLGNKESDVSDDATGFKVFTDASGVSRWLAVWSNNFKDRDGEIFTAKAMDDYVSRVDKGLVKKPELWVWHTPGTRIGQADWVDRHGHFMLAGGTFDSTPEAQHAKAYYQKHADDLGVSHGFQFPSNRFDGKHYHSFNTVEISPLLGGFESNLLTAIPIEGIKAMTREIQPEKKQHLINVLGQERTDRLLKSLDEGGKAFEELGVEYKEFTAPEIDTPAVVEAVDAAEKEFGALVADLAEGSTSALQAALSAVKEAKAVRAELATALAELGEMRKELALRPRASQASATSISEAKAKELFPDVVTQVESIDPFWNNKVQQSLNGNS